MLLLLQLSSKYLPLAYNVLQGFVRAISLAKEAMKHWKYLGAHKTVLLEIIHKLSKENVPFLLQMFKAELTLNTLYTV